MVLHMDNLGDLLGRSKYKEPKEIAQIKKFVWEQFEATPDVELGKNSIIITVDSAPLATSLRYKIIELNAILNTNKKLVIRIK